MKLPWTVMLYGYEQMEVKLLLERCWPTRRAFQRSLKNFSVKSLLDADRTIELTNREHFVTESMTRLVIDAIIFLAAQSHCNGCVQNVVHYCSPKLCQALHLWWLKQGQENSRIHSTALITNQIFVANACESCWRLIVCLEHSKEEVLQVRLLSKAMLPNSGMLNSSKREMRRSYLTKKRKCNLFVGRKWD